MNGSDAVRLPAWYLLLVAVPGILSGCHSLRDLERFSIRPHAVAHRGAGHRAQASAVGLIVPLRLQPGGSGGPVCCEPWTTTTTAVTVPV
jgi:hypothetical protein